MACLTAGLAGCAMQQDEPTPTSGITGVEADRAARLLTLQEEGRVLGRGSGASMLPLYGENTRVIVAPILFEDLQPEMIVAYRDRENRTVVHRLVSLHRDRWTVAGINNPQYDRDPVTAENLIGIVYAFIHSEQEDG